MSDVFNYLIHNEKRTIELLQELVRIPTENPPGKNYQSIVDLLASHLERLGFDTEIFTVPTEEAHAVLEGESRNFPRYNVLGKWDVGAKETIHFNAHYDVVPVSSEWRFNDPFSGKVEDGWMYGRGTADMKGAIASFLSTMEALRECKRTPKYNIEVSFTADEETGGTLGAGWIAKSGKIQPDVVLVLEGGGQNRVGCGHNGAVWMEVTIYGKSAHGSTPYNGVNALEKMSELIGQFQRYKEEISKRSLIAPNGKKMTPTINLGGVFGGGEGGKVNTVPGLATFTIDRRVLINESSDEVEKELIQFIESTAKEVLDCKVTTRTFLKIYSCFTDPENPFLQDFEKSIQHVQSEPVGFSISSGFNDSGLFSKFLQVPTIGYGPSGEKLHAVDERLKVSELLQCAKSYAHFLISE